MFIALFVAGRPAAAVDAGLEDLTPAAQFAVSAALGREAVAYHAVAAAGEGFRAANPEQGFATELTAGGFTVSAGALRWGLSLEAWGCGGKVEAVAPAVPRARDNRVELRRGPVVEWYENGPLGLQQGFTLERAPRGCGSDEPVRLVLAPAGDLTLTVEDGGRGLRVGGDRGSALRYRGLAAFEAGGREVPARMNLEEGRVVLEVDAGVRYPLVVDPFVQMAKLTSSTGSRTGLFGRVAVSGNTVVVGEYFAGKGTAYVFVEPARGWSGGLTETAKLVASDGMVADFFGTAVAMAGDTIVVGTDPRRRQGAAYVFERPAGGWAGTLTEKARLTTSDRANAFSAEVAIDGDTVVVGAAGSAYVFLKPAGGWAGQLTHNAKLFPSRSNTGFGREIALSGDTVVGGGGVEDNFRGAAYVFVKPVGGWAGTFTEKATLTASDGAASDRFGGSVAIVGDTLVVGASHDSIGSNQQQGSVYVFVKPPGGWAGALTQNAKLTASDGTAGDTLGFAVAMAGDTVVAGAYLDVTGSVYVFQKPSGGWVGNLTETTKLTAFDGSQGDQFGEDLAFDGDTLAVGAIGDTIGDNLAQGSAYVFRLCCSCMRP